MISILEEPETREMVVPISREFYNAAGAAGLLDRDVELLEGIIIKKTPKSPYHILLVRRLIEMLEAFLAGDSAKADYFVAKEDPIAAGGSEPEPDIAVIRGTPEAYASELPVTSDLVIEVAVSTLEKDRSKAGIYASIEVPEYWIVDGLAKRIEVLTRLAPDRKEYKERVVLEIGETASSSVFPGFEVNLKDLFRVEK